MRRIILLGILITVLVFIPPAARCLVFLNVQWNEDTEEWEAMPLVLEGEGLSLNRSYQNAYGRHLGIEEGPPFIISDSIIIRNTYDEHDEVDDWGNLSVMAYGGGDKPFTLEFHPPSGGGDYSTITVEGELHIEGTPSDRVIFKGSYSISNGQWGHVDPSPHGPEISLEYCVFDSVGYGGTCSPNLITLRSAHLFLNNCHFSNFYPLEMDRVIFCEMASIYDTPDERITIRECVFENLFLDAAPPIELSNPYGPFGEVRIESNEFTDVIFDGSSWDDGVLINLDSFAEGRITGNTGSGNTNTAFWIRGTGGADGSMTLRSSDELPFLVGQITVAEGRTLTVEEGSVLKMSELSDEANFRVYGDLIADGAIFSSWEDDSVGGDNDLQPEPPSVGYWGSTNEGGILIGQNGTLQMRNSAVTYARSGVHARGDALVDGCTFQRNEYTGFSGGKGGGIDGYYEITNSTFTDNGNNGISFLNDGLRQTMMIDNVRSIGNARGIHIGGYEVNPAYITVSRSVFAGNEKAAVRIIVAPGLQTCTMSGCNISGNLSAGISAEDYDGDEAVLRFESCVIAGNGYDFFSGEGTHGAGIEGGRPYFVNNTVAWNRSNGYYSVPPQPLGGEEDIANNIFISNGGRGFVNYNELPSRFSHNLFRENDDGELRIEADEGDFSSVVDLQPLGGGYATNLSTDPVLLAGLYGEVDSVRYLEDDNRSYLFSEDAAGDGRDLSEMIVRPDIHELPWFFITRHSGDTLVIAGDITGVAEAGDSLNIFDHHLDWSSPVVDAGNSALPAWPLDIDGDHRIIDGDGSTIPDVDIGADEFSADSVTLVLLSPEPDAYWTAEEERNVTWSAVGIDTVNLYYLAPYHPDSNLVAIEMKQPASDGRYKWTVPDSLSTRCRVIIKDDADEDHFVESGFFTIRSPVLARIGLDGEYEGYSPRVDGWQIHNVEASMWSEVWWSRFDYLAGTDPYTGRPYPDEFNEFWSVNAQPDDFPDWPLFVEAFGTDQCYIDTPDGPQYSPSALWKWTQFKGEWGGSCFGFGQSSYEAFDDKTTFLASFPDVDNFDSLYTLGEEEDFRHRKTINLLMTRQYCREYLDHAIASLAKDPRETLREIREMLLDETRDDRAIVIVNQNGSGAHLVNPYRLERDGLNPDCTWIYVYDSNFPGDRTARLLVHEGLNSWSYANLANWGGSSGFFLTIPASEYLSPTTLGDPGPAPPGAGRAPSSNGTHHEYYTPAGTEVTIYDGSGGYIGFADSVTFNTISGAMPVIPLGTEYSPPVGFVVPAGEYTAQLTGFPDTLARFGMAVDSLKFSCVRSGAHPSETDRFVCGDGIMVGNYDGITKTINTRTISAGASEERLFDMLGVALAQYDSIGFEADGGGVHVASNYGGAKSYDLGIESVSGAGRSVFRHAGISLPAGTGHRISPDWNDLESVPVKIYIDTENDGSIDDSLLVENEYVATLLRHFSASFRDPFIEITWRMSDIDDGVEFIVQRAGAGEAEFTGIPGVDVSSTGLSFKARDRSVEYGEDYRYRVLYLKEGESRILFETGEIGTPVMPLRLYQNYPNPFNPVTRIRCYLPARAKIRLDIYDVAGRRIVTLADGVREKGPHIFIWDGKNASGKLVGSGIYFYRLKAGKSVLSRKMVIVR